MALWCHHHSQGQSIGAEEYQPQGLPQRSLGALLMNSLVWIILIVGPLIGFVFFVKFVGWFFDRYTEASTFREIKSTQKRYEMDTLMGRK